jgi:hypothetical protein
MEESTTECNCCFGEVKESLRLICTGNSTHSFCFECVCDYLLSMSNYRTLDIVNLECIHKRACEGKLWHVGIDQFLKGCRVGLELLGEKLNSGNLDTTIEDIGIIVKCSTCSVSIRKLVSYNYVACRCGTVVCYECGENITHKVHRHPCSPVNERREPSWHNTTTDKEPQQRESRTFRSLQIYHSQQGAEDADHGTMTLYRTRRRRR